MTNHYRQDKTKTTRNKTNHKKKKQEIKTCIKRQYNESETKNTTNKEHKTKTKIKTQQNKSHFCFLSEQSLKNQIVHFTHSGETIC